MAEDLAHRATPEHTGRKHVEHVVGVVGVGEADPTVTDARERLRSHRDDDIGRQQQDRREHSSTAGRATGVSRLFVDRDGGVPAPINEDHQDRCGNEEREGGDVEGVEPPDLRGQVFGRCIAGRDTDESGDGEDEQHHELDAEQDLLEVRRYFDAAVTDVGHHGDPRDAHEQDPCAGRVAADAVGIEEQEAVLPRDLRETRHDEDVGGEDAPPAGVPPDLGTEGSGRPCERGAAVGIRLVHLGVGDCDAQHRNEREDHHDRRLHADEQDDETEGRRQAVCGRHRGDAHDNARKQAERTLLETFFRRQVSVRSVLSDGAHVCLPWLVATVVADFSVFDKCFRRKGAYGQRDPSHSVRSPAMRVLVVGAGGVGGAFARIAARHRFLDQVVLADFDESRARAAAAAAGDKFVGVAVDANDESSVRELLRSAGCDALLNATDPRFVMPLFRAALDAETHYLDMAMSLAQRHPDRPYAETGVMLGDEQFALAGDWEKRGKLALVGMGVEPGLSDVFARYAADELFSSIDEVGVRDGADLTVDGYDFAPTFSIWTTIEECLNPPLVYEKDRGWFTTEPFSEPEVFRFPEGIGEVECVNVEHEEVVLIPRWVEARRVTFKYGLGDEFIDVLSTLHKLGLDRTDKVTVGGAQVSPRDVVAACLPDPATLGDKMSGKTCAGLFVTGKDKAGQP